MKSFWQHENGRIYAVRSNTFGKVTGAAGPLNPDALANLDSYGYGPAIVRWVEGAIAAGKLRRVNPAFGAHVTRATGTIAP